MMLVLQGNFDTKFEKIIKRKIIVGILYLAILILYIIFTWFCQYLMDSGEEFMFGDI